MPLKDYVAVMRHFRLLSVLAIPVLAAACSTVDRLVPDMGMGRSVSSPASVTGLAVSDEPFAAQTGASILRQGGSAADAVTAMFFTLTATYPVAAGLGGGGLCLVHESAGTLREFDFLPRAAGGGGAYAVPGAVAGFADLHKAFGILPWQRTVAPGEAYAATGFPVSHVLSLRLAAAQNVIRLDAALSAEFLDESGQPKPQGAVVANKALSETLSEVRLNGAAGFYAGRVAESIATYSAAQGGSISAADLSRYRGTQGAGRMVRSGPLTVGLPGLATGAGAFMASLMSNLGGAGADANAVSAGLRATLAGFNIQAVPPDLGSTGFAALDANGQAAACALTMNGPFGSGHTAGDTGVTLAAQPAAPAGIASAFLTPLIASDGARQVVLAGVGTGGPNGSAALAYALLRVSGGLPVGRPGDLRSTGLAPFATVNAISCESGACVALPDPGGSGLGVTADDPVGSNAAKP